MPRTRLFISYSHRDREWLDRLDLHLGLMQRRGLVHVWSDTRIGIGSVWEEEIERALSDSQIAVLLVSPGFLASEYIWNQEMPKVVAHRADGMEVLPLIVKPCAWRLEEHLSELQAHPPDGWALSLASDAQIDLELSVFVYELAAKLEVGSDSAAGFAAREREISAWRRMLRAQTDTPSAAQPISRGAAPDTRRVRAQHADALPWSWKGTYKSRDGFVLRIRKRKGTAFRGSIEYTGTETITAVEGEIVDDPEIFGADPRWVRLTAEAGDAALALRFRETEYEKPGRRTIDMSGEYLAFVSGDMMSGAWFDGDHLVGHFVATAVRGRVRASGQ